MAVKFSKGGSGLEWTGEKISIRLDQSQGVIHLARKDGSIKFGPILFWAGFKPAPDDKKFLFSTVVIPGEPETAEDFDTPIGRANLIQWPVSLAGCEFIWEIACFEKEDFAAFRVRMKNSNQAPAWACEISPFAYRGAGDGLELGAGYTVWKFFRLGYQSWSPAGTIDFQEPQPRPRNFLAKKIGVAPYLHNRQAPWVWSSEWMAEIVEPELDASVLIGFIEGKQQTGVVEAEVKYERFRRFEAVSDCECAQILPGEKMSTDWAIAMLTDAPRGSQKKYFDLCAQAMNARKTKPINGWCSWYYYFEGIDQAAFEKNLAEAPKLNPKIDLFQLDDGFESAVGDWLKWKSSFPGDAQGLADKIHGQGLKAGIWLAPFMASSSSELYKQHRDWFLKNSGGRPLLAMLKPRWKGLSIYALDATHPEFQNWLKELVRKLTIECKFDFLKLDFLFAASLHGQRYDKRATGAFALRKGLETIRKAAGEKCYILGCGSPLLPAVGMVDAMRVSQDTKRAWKTWLDLLFGISIAPSLRNCLKNNLARSLTANRLWALDPDCLLLTTDNKLSQDEMKSQLAIFHLLAGQIILSEDLNKLDADHLNLFSLAMPAAQKPAEPIDLFDRPFPQELFCSGEVINLLALFNWSEEPKPAKINLAKYGLKKKYHLFEFWTREYLGEIEGRVEAGKIAPHGVKYFALTEVSDQPQIIGLDFHLGMGQGCAKIESEKISIAIPGRRKGNIYIKMPGEKSVRLLPVNFENSTTISI